MADSNNTLGLSSNELERLRFDIYSNPKGNYENSVGREYTGGFKQRKTSPGQHAMDYQEWLHDDDAWDEAPIINQGVDFGYYKGNKNWNKVQDHLGINQLNKTQELSDMYDWVLAQDEPAAKKSREEEDDGGGSSEPEKPAGPRPDQVQLGKDQDALKNSSPGTPPSTQDTYNRMFSGVVGAYRGDTSGTIPSDESRLNMGVANDKKDWFHEKWMPYLKNKSNATVSESTSPMLDSIYNSDLKLPDWDDRKSRLEDILDITGLDEDYD